MTGSFWLVYLVSPPQALDFSTAILFWLLTFGVATAAVVVYARRPRVRATPSMLLGLGCAIGGHLAFAFLPPLAILAVAGTAFGLYLPAFWLPMNTLLAKETRAADRAGRLAGVTATFTIVAVVAPILGGLAAEAVGYRVLFLLGVAIVGANFLLISSLAQRDEASTYRLDFRRLGGRTSLAFSGQGGSEGLLSVAAPLSAFLFTQAAFGLGLLFALFSFAAGATTWALGRLSDRARVRRPFLVLGPILAVPASVAAAVTVMAGADVRVFAFAVGWLSMASAMAPSFIFTIAVERMEDALAGVAATRELLLNASRSVALAAGLVLLALGSNIAFLYLLVAGVILLEVLAR